MKRFIIINRDQGVFHLANRSMAMFSIKPYGYNQKFHHTHGDEALDPAFTPSK